MSIENLQWLVHQSSSMLIKQREPGLKEHRDDGLKIILKQD